MPNPFELFNKNEKKDIDEEKDTKEGFLESMRPKNDRKDIGAVTNAPLPGQPEKNVELTAVLIGAFFILSIILGMLYYFNSIFMLLDSLMESTFGEKQTDFYSENEFNKIFGGKIMSFSFWIFIILWMVVFCINILIFQVVLNIDDYAMMFYMTTVYFFGIVGGTMMIINNVPSLVEVFENTIGTAILPMISNMNKVIEVFKHKGFETQTEQMTKLGVSMKLDFLLTTFTISNFHDHFKKLFLANPKSEDVNEQKDTTFYIDVTIFDEKNLIEKPYLKNINHDVTNRARYNLLRLVLQKYTIGHFTWIVLASYVSILLAVNTMPYA